MEGSGPLILEPLAVHLLLGDTLPKAELLSSAHISGLSQTSDSRVLLQNASLFVSGLFSHSGLLAGR